jgi:3-methyladenine DNA glycosylase AlkD
MNETVKQIQAELKKAVDPSSKDGYKRYFKEEVKFHGVRAAQIHSIAKKHWQEVKRINKENFISICEELLRSGYGEEKLIVGLWLPKIYKSYTREDIFMFRNWIDKYISNWAECDTFCNHTMDHYLDRFPEAIEEIMKWTASDNRWLKRAAAVSLVIPARKGKFLPQIFQIADELLASDDDMVQKGYGWMLKEASKVHMDKVYQFVLARRKTMPRTALRYAIEKMPENMRKEAMKK